MRDRDQAEQRLGADLFAYINALRIFAEQHERVCAGVLGATIYDPVQCCAVSEPEDSVEILRDDLSRNILNMLAPVARDRLRYVVSNGLTKPRQVDQTLLFLTEPVWHERQLAEVEYGEVPDGPDATWVLRRWSMKSPGSFRAMPSDYRQMPFNIVRLVTMRPDVGPSWQVHAFDEDTFKTWQTTDGWKGGARLGLNPSAI